jgi:hypothetical protein
MILQVETVFAFETDEIRLRKATRLSSPNVLRRDRHHELIGCYGWRIAANR